jgi:hypothetical protein
VVISYVIQMNGPVIICMDSILLLQQGQCSISKSDTTLTILFCSALHEQRVAAVPLPARYYASIC